VTRRKRWAHSLYLLVGVEAYRVCVKEDSDGHKRPGEKGGFLKNEALTEKNNFFGAKIK